MPLLYFECKVIEIQEAAWTKTTCWDSGIFGSISLHWVQEVNSLRVLGFQFCEFSEKGLSCCWRDFFIKTCVFLADNRYLAIVLTCYWYGAVQEGAYVAYGEITCNKRSLWLSLLHIKQTWWFLSWNCLPSEMHLVKICHLKQLFY